MKFIASADWHIREYIQYNLEEDFRYKQYLKLASQMKEVALANDVKAFIIAGDIFDKYYVEGKDVHYFYEACSILLEVPDSKIYVTHGNHEIDSKYSFSRLDTVLPSICNKHTSGRIIYCDDELVDIEGVKFYFKGYRPSFELPKDVAIDIFVGHEYVSGAILPNKTTTSNDKNLEVANIGYAIMGDIHKSQIVQKGKVFIPGAPIQNSFKDDANAGFDLLEFSAGKLSRKHILTKDVLHFYYEDEFKELNREANELDIIRSRNLDRALNNRDEILEKSKLFNTKEILATLLSKYQYGGEVLGKLKRFEDSESSKDLQVKLLNLKIENFKSIKKLEIDFSDFKKLAILQGPVGAGKTTFLQAIIWNLTGYCYKDKSDVIKIGTECCKVELSLSFDGHIFEIIRTYGSSKDLIVHIDARPLDANNMTRRQEKLEEALPIIGKLNLIYFSQSRDGLLNELSDSSRVGLISELAGLNCVDALTSEFETFYTEVSGKVSENNRILTNTKLKLDTLESNLKKVDDPTSEIELVKTSLDDINNKLTTIKSEEDRIIYAINSETSKALQESDIQIQQLVANSSEIDFCIKDTIAKIAKNNHIIEAKSTYKCPTCGTIIEAKDITDEMRTNASKSNDELKPQLEKFNQLKASSVALHREALAKRENIQKVSNAKISEIRDTYQKNNFSLIESKSNFSKRLGELEYQLADFKKYVEQVSIIDREKANLDAYTSEQNILMRKLDDYEQIYKNIFGRDGLLAANILQKLSDALNEDDSPIKISTCKLQKNGKVKPTLDISLNVQGSWIKYSILSGGQTLYADLYFMMKLISAVGGVGFLILDETFKYFDPEITKLAAKMLNSIKSNNIFLVNHGELSSAEDASLINVKLLNGDSQYDY